MKPEALELLSESHEVRRLVVAWTVFKRGSTKNDDNMKDIYRWARAAGVATQLAARWKAPLLENGIINLDGTIDQEARGYILRSAMRRVPIRRQPAAKPAPAASTPAAKKGEGKP